MGALDGLRYAIREIAAHHDERSWWRTRLQQRINGTVQQRVRGYDGVDVMDEEWDTLCVLDACRLDLFEQHWDSADETHDDVTAFENYRRVTSKGSWTVEWAKRNFTETYGDTVYVTANPLISEHVPDRWHRLVDVWRDGFEEEIQSVPPEAVTEEAVRIHERYSEKRVIVHYVQPHAPFIYDEELQFGVPGGFKGWEDGGEADVKNVWEALRKGLVARDDVEQGYVGNLQSLLEPVGELVDAIDGKIVLTSDHGNEYGRLSWPLPIRTYGHPPGQRLAGLVRVPWAELSHDDRRDVTRGSVESVSASGGDEVESRLRALGYAD